MLLLQILSRYILSGRNGIGFTLPEDEFRKNQVDPCKRLYEVKYLRYYLLETDLWLIILGEFSQRFSDIFMNIEREYFPKELL